METASPQGANIDPSFCRWIGPQEISPDITSIAGPPRDRPRLLPGIGRALACIFALAASSVGNAQTGVGDRPLDELIAEAKRPLAEAKETADSETKARTGKYVADLRALEDRVAEDTGDLDQVLLIRREADSWEKGERTPAIDPKDKNYPLDLRKLRYYFEQDRSRILAGAEETASKAGSAVVSRLRALEAALTQARRVDDAIAVRNEAGELQAQSAPPETKPPATGGSPEPGEIIEVSPKGTGRSVTLDEALKNAKKGQILELGPGEYPPSKESGDDAYNPPYKIGVRDLIIRSSHATVPHMLIHADGVTVDGIECPQLRIGLFADKLQARKTVIRRSSGAFRVENQSSVSLHNCIGQITVLRGGTLSADHCTLIADKETGGQHSGHYIQGSTDVRITRSVLYGSPILFQIYYADSLRSPTIKDSLLYSPDVVVEHYDGKTMPATSYRSLSDARKAGLRMSDCEFDVPDFLSPKTGNFRLKNNSPGKAKEFGENDLGANIGPDGFPVPFDDENR
jgi:hypothetical protein